VSDIFLFGKRFTPTCPVCAKYSVTIAYSHACRSPVLIEAEQPFLAKASLRSNGVPRLPNPLSSSKNAAQNRLVLSQRARFKTTYSELHEFERAPLFLHSRALIKRL
jgi:hypothetical protein